MNINEEIRNAIAMRTTIQRTMTDLNVALHHLNDAQATHREAAEFLKSTEDQVVATATLTKDERLPSAVSSPGYKPALNTIIQEAHNDELLDDVKAHNDTRERMEVWSLTAEQAKNRLNALKAQADLQAVILTAMTMAADQPAVRTVPTPVGRRGAVLATQGRTTVRSGSRV